MASRTTIILLAFLQMGLPPVQAEENTFFDEQVAPILVRRCTQCHNGFDRKGGFNLVVKKEAFAGGDSGEVLKPGEPGESLLWERVSSGEMPPEVELRQDEKEILKKWITNGAKWESDRIDVFRFTTDTRAGRDWWSLQPVRRPSIPATWSGHPIDFLVRKQLADSKLQPSPQADRRTLIRRASYDLTGLPPEPNDVEAFVQDDSPNAYDELLRRLLASDHHGERWARHWLDVARYGESDGFEYDRMRPNAWHYRDWVISAINHDVPYDEFVRLQLAGDVLKPNDRNAITATGFLVCGAHDGLIPQGDVMRKIMRQDALEDFVGTVSQTFLGLTANCARCHDHKFDPISQVEYYQLASSLAGVHHGERPVPADAQIENELNEKIATLQQQIAAIENPVRDAILKQRANNPEANAQRDVPTPLIEFDFSDLESPEIKDGKLHGEARIENGTLLVDGNESYFESQVLSQPLAEKTLTALVKLADLDQRGGAAICVQTPDGGTFDAIVFGERDPKQWMAGSDGFSRTKSFEGPEENTNDEFVHFAITYQADGTITGYRNGEPYGKPYQSPGLHIFEARKHQVILGLRHSPSNASRLLKGQIQRARVFAKALSADEILSAMGENPNYVSTRTLLAALDPQERERREKLNAELDQRRAELASYRASKVYAVVAKQPPVGHLLNRGNPLSPAQSVVPAGIQSLSLNADFGLNGDAPDAERRKQLAVWITNPKNPLFARVMVNRVWMHHFGRGLVLTPNDFGFNGGKPSHPELLDWLASEFMDKGWSVKKLHHLIMTSETFKQASQDRSEASTLDADNRLLWKFTARRLDAEEIRDSILAVSGKLVRQIGGAPFQDVRPYLHRGAQFYETIDPVGEAYNRRSIYRMWARGGRNPLLDAFDCPDPSATAPARATTTTPLQALAMMNQSFVLRMSDEFAGRLQSNADQQKQIHDAFLVAFQRTPGPDELAAATELVEKFGIKALCRVIFNSNEFLTVE